MRRQNRISNGKRALTGILRTLCLFVCATLTAPGFSADMPATNASAAPSNAAETGPLRGTIVTRRPGDSRVIIEDGKGVQHIYGLGDEVPGGGTVAKIYADRIVLQRAGQRLTLGFFWKQPERSFDDPDAKTSAEPYFKTLRAAMLSQPGLLLQLVGTIPITENDRFRGFRVIERDDSSLLDVLGLKPGDVLTAVNGVPLDGPGEGRDVLNGMAGTGGLTYTVQRGGQILVLGD